MLQCDALSILQEGKNVFLTGEPGAGKSHTLRMYVTYLKEHGVPFALTATTGIAATHLGGVTLHSWSGLGIRKRLSLQDCREIAASSKAKDIQKAAVLLIDEISMLDGMTLDSLDFLCRVVRETDVAFGGMQVVFVGDFFQLPPVSRPDEPQAQFAFHSSAWRAANVTVCYLSEQHRQDDQDFLALLAALRRGEIEDGHIAMLSARCLRESRPHTETILYSHNADVDRMNAERLRKISGRATVFRMKSFGNAKLIEGLKRGCLSPEHLEVKVGARVMFTRNNLMQGYANGTIGEVVDFDRETGAPVVQLASGRVILVDTGRWMIDGDGGQLAMLEQFPLRLAWAMTVHKSQGMTLDSAFIDLSNAFVYGQGYVALSRVRSLEGLVLKGFNRRALEVDPEVLAADQLFREASCVAEEECCALSEAERRTRAQNFLRRAGGQIEPKVFATVDAFASFFTKKPKKVREPKWTETVRLVKEGHTIQDVARLRSRTVGTVVGHLAEAHEAGSLPDGDFARLCHDAKDVTDVVHPAMIALHTRGRFLKPVFEHFQGKFSYDELRIAQWLLEAKKT